MLRAAVLTILVTRASAAWSGEPTSTPDPVAPAFKEIWAYLMRGEEGMLTGAEPITDLCSFGVNLERDGRIRGSFKRPELILRDGTRPAVHLVVAELSNQALMHFALDPRYGVTPLLVGDICRIATDYDGVQIDFESVARDDAAVFHDFLRLLRTALPPEKVLSIAVPARTRLVADAYDYTRIAPIVDRMVIMAYDEHWSTSAPGPVASLPWCTRIVDYAASVVDRGKIVMGLPLYGRAWQDKKPATALRFANVQELVAGTRSTIEYAPEAGACFQYTESVVVTVYYDDIRSLVEKLRLYRGRNIGAVSFWRIGQGPVELWSSIERAVPPRDPAEGDRSGTSSSGSP